MKKTLSLLLALAMVLSLGAVSALAAGAEQSADGDETVLLDDDTACVAVTGYDPAGSWDGGPALEIRLENKTDVELYFEIAGVVVNGRVLGAWGQSVPAGEEATDEIVWQTEQLAQSGINYIETVQGALCIRDYDNYDVLETVDVAWTAPVDGQEGPAVSEPDYGHGFEPVEVLAEGDMALTVVDYDPVGGGDDRPQLMFHVVNGTDSAVRFGLDDVTVNGFLCDPYWGVTVPAGAEAYTPCIWWEEELESAHVKTVQTVAFTVQARDDSSYDVIASAPASLTVAEDAQEADDSSVELEGAVLLDDETASVTVTGYDPTGSWEGGPAVEILLENKSDTELYFEIPCVLINGRVLSSWGEMVAAGAKSYSELQWDPEQLAQSGVNYIETLQGALNVRDYDNYETMETVDVTWTAPTDDQQGPAVSEPDYGHGFEPVPVMESDGLSVTLVDYDPTYGGEDYNSPRLMFHVVNGSDSVVRFGLQDVVVNGTACDPYWGVSVPAGAEAYSPCTWWPEELEDAHIDALGTVDFTVVARNDETYDVLASVPGSVTLDESVQADGASEGILLVEGSLARITATDYDPEQFSFELLTENLSEQELYFSLEDVTVNGMAIPTYWSTTVQPGMRSYEELFWNADRMELNGIRYIQDVTATLRISSGTGAFIGENQLAWSAPTEGMEGPAWEEPVFDGMEPVEVLTGDVSLTVVDYLPPTEDWGDASYPRLVLCARNDSDQEVDLSMTDCAVNGIAYSGGPYTTLPAGAGLYYTFSIDPYYMEEDPGEIETVTLGVEVRAASYGYGTIASGSATVDVTGLSAEAPAA